MIHLIETDKRPKTMSLIEMNCGKKIIFKTPIEISFTDGNLCETCLNIHRSSLKLKLKTFAHGD